MVSLEPLVYGEQRVLAALVRIRENDAAVVGLLMAPQEAKAKRGKEPK
jgi:hypothetical protein